MSRQAMIEGFVANESLIHSLQDKIESIESQPDNEFRDNNLVSIWREQLDSLVKLNAALNLALWEVYDTDIYSV